MAYTMKFGILGLTMALAAPATGAAPTNTTGDQAKYCIQYETATGSRINHVECRTKAEWAKLGVNVDELVKK